VTIPSAQEAPDNYRKLNSLAKVPTFVGSDGFVLSECIAIALYSMRNTHQVLDAPKCGTSADLTLIIVTSLNEKTTLLGDTKQDYASIVRWMSFANSEILPSLGGWFNPLIGRAPFNKQENEKHRNATLQKVQILEDHLRTRTYLVGEPLTLADLFVTGVVAGGFMCFFDKAWRAEHPAVTRWFELVHAQPIYADVAGKPVLVEIAMPNYPMKKPEQPVQQTPAKEESSSSEAAGAVLDTNNETENQPEEAPQAVPLVLA
jgi:elongation factor 1-gamma